jgi:hypothetical protein
MNSEPLSEPMPYRGKGSAWRISSSAWRTPSWPLPSTARVSVQGCEGLSGFTEVDPVSHFGNSANGEFRHSLNLAERSPQQVAF